MIIRRQRIREAKLLHHHETYAIRERKLLIQMLQHELAGGGKAARRSPLQGQSLGFFGEAKESQALTLEWTSPGRFAAARKFMLKHLDQEFSFTDCVSFVVMKEFRLTDALATDNHFRIAGFNPLLAG